MRVRTLTVLNVWQHENGSTLLITFIEANAILDVTKEALKEQGIHSLKPGDIMTIYY